MNPQTTMSEAIPSILPTEEIKHQETAEIQTPQEALQQTFAELVDVMGSEESAHALFEETHILVVDAAQEKGSFTPIVDSAAAIAKVLAHHPDGLDTRVPGRLLNVIEAKVKFDTSEA